MADLPVIRHCGQVGYADALAAMQDFTAARAADAPDELWLLEHPPVFTLGLAGRREHLLAPGDIPVIHADRGGQVTYHGPGQAMGYALLDLARRRLGVKDLVAALEGAVLAVLADHGVAGARRAGAPGVYVGARKIASVGLRVRRGCSYHGVALNVAMDLAPFRRIEPCGYAGLEMTQLADLCRPAPAVRAVADALAAHLVARLRARTS